MGAAMRTQGFALFHTAIGPCGIAWSAAGIAGVQLPEADDAATRERMMARFPDASEQAMPGDVELAASDIAGLLRGERGARSHLRRICLDLQGVSEFHRRVYALAREVGPGQTTTYGELARRLGEPGSARAVGRAMALNPFAPVVPCHRVLAAHGRGGGFSASGGVATKLRMLTIERARFGEPGLFDEPAGERTDGTA